MTKEPRKVLNATRDAVVSVASHVQTLRQKTTELAQKAENKWEESKPRRQEAKDELKKVAHHVVGFGRDVRDGLKEGFAEVQKRNKKGA